MQHEQSLRNKIGGTETPALPLIPYILHVFHKHSWKLKFVFAAQPYCTKVLKSWDSFTAPRKFPFTTF